MYGELLTCWDIQIKQTILAGERLSIDLNYTHKITGQTH